MQLSDPETYLKDIVRPLIRRFEADRVSFDLAIACCIVLYHFADVAARAKNNISTHAMAQKIAAVEPKFHVVRALANAAKHVELKRHPIQNLVGLKSDDLSRGPAAAFTDGTYWSDGTSWTDAPETIIVITPDRQQHDVLHLCTSVVDTIESHRAFF